MISYKTKKHVSLFQIHLDDNETIFKLNELLHQYVVHEFQIINKVSFSNSAKDAKYSIFGFQR